MRFFDLQINKKTDDPLSSLLNGTSFALYVFVASFSIQGILANEYYSRVWYWLWLFQIVTIWTNWGEAYRAIGEIHPGINRRNSYTTLHLT